mmetsp:Transcript_99009/g.317540  ORF Transcript_99009/g.317540 Transcript_99009/m.317540 type:complete len:142 (-) Transcript_99009:83-508(-)
MAGNGGSLANAREMSDKALGVMRGNMTMLAERDSKLHELQDKSVAFQSTSQKFQRSTVTLGWKTRWQQYRLYAWISALVVWGTLLLIFRHHLLPYLIISSAIVGAAYGVFKLFERRLSMGPESQQPLTAGIGVGVNGDGGP